MFLFLFILLYFEHTSFGIVKISQLWKLPFYFYFTYYVFVKYSKITYNIPRYLFLALLLFLLININTSIPSAYIYNFSEAFAIITLPLSIAYFKIRSRKRDNNIELFLIIFSTFLILYNLPFIFNLLPQRNSVHDLDKYGLENQGTLIGVFYHTNISSKINVVATLFIIFNKNYFNYNIFKKILYWALIIVGSYSIYLNFTRTGWLLYIIGILFVLFYKESMKRIILISVPMVIIMSYLAYTFVANNPAVILRLLGETIYRSNEDLDINQI